MPTSKTSQGPDTLRRAWVIVTPGKSWSEAYGPFPSHDACVEWARRNGYHPSDLGIHPLQTPLATQEVTP